MRMQTLDTAIQQFTFALVSAGIGAATYVITAATGWLQQKTQKDPRPHVPLQVGHRGDIEIHVVLDRLRYELDAQRVYLSKYHNGDRYIDGSDIIRKSRTHERVRPGVSYQTEDYRGVLVSSLAEETMLVIEEGPTFTWVRNISESKFRWLCEVGGVVAVARCAVLSKDGSITGFVGVDFDGDIKEKPANIERLCEAAHQIAVILNQYNK